MARSGTDPGGFPPASHAVVTGAGSGIGRAISLALAASGMRLLLLGRDKEKLETTAREAGPSATHRIQTVSVDLARDDALARLAPGLPERIDALVHSAGAYARLTMEATTPADLGALLQMNVQVPLALTRACLPGLRRARGQVVFINSSQGARAGHSAGAYAASKHALRALADSLRQEVNADGIRVLSVFPGRTATPMQASVHAAEGRAYAPARLMQPDAVAAMVLAALRLPDTAEVTELFMRPARLG